MRRPGDLPLFWFGDRQTLQHPVTGAMGEGMGMGGNGMGSPPPSEPPAPPPPPPPPPPSPGGAVKGSLWIDGSNIHWIDANGVDQARTGSSQGTPPGALAGSVWDHGIVSNTFRYIDASGVLRFLDHTINFGAVPPGGLIGSRWVEGGSLVWIVDSAGTITKVGV